MLTSDKASFTIDCVAVRIHRRLAEDAQMTVVLAVPHDAIVWDVAEQHIPAGREIHRAFGPPHAGGDALDRHGTREAREPGLSEGALGLFERLDMRIRIATAGQRPQWQGLAPLKRNSGFSEW